jgi:hypothetical protein
MFNIKQYRAKAAEYEALSDGATDPGQSREYKKSSDSFGSLAENEEWLADNFNKTVQLPDEKQLSHAALAAEEEYVLRCLGASVIMQWNTIPTKLRRELFDTAGSMGELLATAELRGQIARFLHKHKDDDSEPRNYMPKITDRPKNEGVGATMPPLQDGGGSFGVGI